LTFLSREDASPLNCAYSNFYVGQQIGLPGQAEESRASVAPDKIAWDYVTLMPILLKIVLTAVATLPSPLMAARAINMTRRPYSIKSWPSSLSINTRNFVYSFRN
jgi:hypothetical protein